ncbi:uncharacterized protein LOC144868513 [Branchiostoma floridae x Branchiostoma japonicum]
MSNPLVSLVLLLISCGSHLTTVRGGVIPTALSSPTAVPGSEVGPTTYGGAVTSGTDAGTSPLTTDVIQADVSSTTTGGAATSGTDTETSPLTTDVTQTDVSPTTASGAVTSGTDAETSPLTTDVIQADISPTTVSDSVTSGTDAQVSALTDVTQADVSLTTVGGAVTSGTDAEMPPLRTDGAHVASGVLEQTTEDASTCNHGGGTTPGNEDVRAERSSGDDSVSPCLVLTAAQVAEKYGDCLSQATSALAYRSYPANTNDRPCSPGDCSELEAGSQSGRPVCPWSVETYQDTNMSPSVITYIQCRTTWPVNLRGDPLFDYNCRHVQYTRRVLVKEGDTCDQGFRYKCVELKIANACVAYIS